MKKNKPLEVGITGGIGSGKSIICKIFQALGTPIYNSDNRAKYLMNNNKTIQNKIIETFGTESYDKHGKLNRNHLVKQVFNNSNKVELLNSIVHPEVKKDYTVWVSQMSNYAYVLNEAALIFETGRYKTLDKVICVSAPEEVRINRVLGRDTHRSKEQVEAIIKKQMPEEEKLSKSDYIIHNDESESVILQVLNLHDAFLKNKENLI